MKCSVCLLCAAIHVADVDDIKHFGTDDITLYNTIILIVYALCDTKSGEEQKNNRPIALDKFLNESFVVHSH